MSHIGLFKYGIASAGGCGLPGYTTITNASDSLIVPTALRYSFGGLRSDGLKFYLIEWQVITFDTIFREYTMSTAFSPSTATLTNSYNATSDFNDGSTQGLGQYGWITSDGLNFYVGNKSSPGEWLGQWSLSTAWDISTASFVRRVYAATLIGASNGFNFEAMKDDGTAMIITDPLANVVLEYSLSTAYDISTQSQTGSKAYPSGTWSLTNVQDSRITFDCDGSAMIACSISDLDTFTFSTAYDLSTVSDANAMTFNFITGVWGNTFYDIAFSGSVMFGIGRTNSGNSTVEKFTFS